MPSILMIVLVAALGFTSIMLMIDIIQKVPILIYFIGALLSALLGDLLIYLIFGRSMLRQKKKKDGA